MQTNAQVNETNSELLKSKAEVSRLSTAVADNSKSTAKLTENVKAQQEQSEAEFVDVRKSLAEKDKAQSEHTEQVRAELGKDINANKEEIEKNKGELSDVSAVVTQNTTAIAETDKTLTEYKQQAQSRFEDNEASINTVQRTLSNIEGSLVESVGQLQAQQNVQGTEILRARASITRIDKVVADNNHAFAQSIEKLETKFDDVNASITTLKKTVSDSEKAQAEVNELIKSEIGDNKAAIEKRAETSVDQQGNSRAYFSIKSGVLHNGQYYDVKIMMNAEVKNGQVMTQIAFAADEFIVFNSVNGQFVTPFAIMNGQVFINSGFIQDGSITNAKIGNVIQSNSYKAGVDGWHINKNGFAEFQNIKARGEINATSGIFSHVTIDESCDVKGTLYAENIKGNIVSGTKDIYINKSWQGTQVVELFKIMKRTQKCYVWVQGALGPYEYIPTYTAVKTPNRSALAYRAPGFIPLGGGDGRCDIYVDGVRQPRPPSYNILDLTLTDGQLKERQTDSYALNEFVVDMPAGEGEASIGISIPHKGGEWTRFIMRARVVIFPATDEVIF